MLRPPLRFLLAVALAPATFAQPAPALLDAVAHSPALAAARHRLAAAHARIDASGRLADPEVEGMASRRSGAMSTGNVDMWELTVRQPLPKRGERAADRERAQAAAAMAAADYAMLAGDIAADTAMALAERDGALARARLLEAQLGRMTAVLQSIESRLAAGTTARIADRLAVESRLAALQLMLEQEQRLAADADTQARSLLSLAPDAPLPDYAAPSPAEIDATHSPALQSAAARRTEADAMSKMARAGARPMTALGLRLEREQTVMGNDDTVGVAFMSEIPWRSRRYARADLRAAEADRAAAHADADAARLRVAAALARVARAERLAASARRLGDETRTRLGAEYDALIRNAGTTATASTDSSVFMAVDLLEKITDTELQILAAETAARVARAELWRHAPAHHFQ